MHATTIIRYRDLDTGDRLFHGQGTAEVLSVKRTRNGDRMAVILRDDRGNVAVRFDRPAAAAEVSFLAWA